MRPIMRAAYLIYRSYLRIARPLSLGAAAVVMDTGGRVLLVRHTYQPGWHLPGGGVKKGESAIEALQRELMEEVGVSFSLQDVKMVGLYYQRASFKHDHQAFFLVKCANPPRSFAPNLEIEEAAFFDPSSLPEETCDCTRYKIREAQRCIHNSAAQESGT